MFVAICKPRSYNVALDTPDNSIEQIKLCTEPERADKLSLSWERHWMSRTILIVYGFCIGLCCDGMISISMRRLVITCKLEDQYKRLFMLNIVYKLNTKHCNVLVISRSHYRINIFLSIQKCDFRILFYISDLQKI